MYCRSCGHAASGEEKRCKHCQSYILTGKLFCQNCGSSTNPKQELCVNCKTMLLNDDTKYLSDDEIKALQRKLTLAQAGLPINILIAIIVLGASIVFPPVGIALLGVGINIAISLSSIGKIKKTLSQNHN